MTPLAFAPASSNEVLALLVQLAAILLVARAFGEAMQRLGQPAVIGEILAGVFLGPSFLSGLVPAAGRWLVPGSGVGGPLLEAFGLFGALLLLLVAGLETDLDLVRRQGRTAAASAAGALVLPMAGGVALGLLLPEALLAHPSERTILALFLGTTLAVSSIPVIARVLIDLKLTRRDIGQAILAAGMCDDVVAWVLLGVVAGLAGGAALAPADVAAAIGKVLGFILFSFTVGRFLARRLLDLVQDRLAGEYKHVSLVLTFTLVWATASHALGIEAAIGAFVAGILFGELPRLPERVRDRVGSMAIGVFAPIFFGVAGLKVNLLRLAEPRLLCVAAAALAIAVVGKVAGAYLGARLVGRRDHWTALALGAGLNARGGVQIIVATVGLDLGVLSQDLFTIIVVMAVATSLMAPPTLRWALARVTPEAEEEQRLAREKIEKESLVPRIRRVLLPVRRREQAGGEIQTIEARVLERMGEAPRASLTLLNVASPGERASSEEFLREVAKLFTGREVTRRVVDGEEPAAAILDEARRHYDLIVLGATEPRAGSRALFNPVVDAVVRHAPCATMVVKGALLGEHWPPRRILVPTNGSLASRRAAEVAFAIASGDKEVLFLNVVVRSGSSQRLDVSGRALERQMSAAESLIEQMIDLGRAQGKRSEGAVRMGPDPESVILHVASSGGIDLIVLGTDVRVGSTHLFLGPRVERLIGNAPCSVIVFNAP